MQVAQSRLSNLPSNFCFLFNGHSLDPNVETDMKASVVAIPHESQYILLIDNVNCNIEPESDRWLSSTSKLLPSPFTGIPIILFFLLGVLTIFCASQIFSVIGRPWRHHEASSHELVPLIVQAKNSERNFRAPTLSSRNALPRARSLRGGPILSSQRLQGDHTRRSESDENQAEGESTTAVVFKHV